MHCGRKSPICGNKTCPDVGCNKNCKCSSNCSIPPKCVVPATPSTILLKLIKVGSLDTIASTVSQNKNRPDDACNSSCQYSRIKDSIPPKQVVSVMTSETLLKVMETGSLETIASTISQNQTKPDASCNSTCQYHIIKDSISPEHGLNMPPPLTTENNLDCKKYDGLGLHETRLKKVITLKRYRDKTGEIKEEFDTVITTERWYNPFVNEMPEFDEGDDGTIKSIEVKSYKDLPHTSTHSCGSSTKHGCEHNVPSK